MKKNINESTPEQLRATLKKFGYVEKNQELTSGGGLQPRFVNVLINFITDWYNKNGQNCKLRFTAGNDRSHGSGSLHKKGSAADITLDNGCHSAFIALLESYKKAYPGFGYLDEYRYKSKGWTGPHFHLSYNPGGRIESNPTNQQPTTQSGSSTNSTSDETTDTSTTSSDDEALSLGLLMPAIQKVAQSGPNLESIYENIKRIKELML
jgi:hypothetical protein